MIPNSADRALPQAPTLPDPDRGLPAAVFRDPPVDANAPAQTLPQAILSSGANLHAVLYTANCVEPWCSMTG
jgi:hypothetical protein